MENTKTIEELINEVNARNSANVYDEERERAYYERMSKLYDSYIEESALITKRFKIRVLITMGVIVAGFTAFFLMRALT